MPVLDLDDFLKKNASQNAGAQQVPASSPAAKPADQSPFAAFTGGSQQNATNAVAGDLLDFRQKTEGSLASIGQDFLKLSGRVTALERNADASQARTEQLISIIDRVQPDRLTSEISDIRAQLSGLRTAGTAATQTAGSGAGVPGPEPTGAVRRLETEYIELSSRLRPMEVALEQLKAWADRDKDYFIKTDEAHNKLAELERKIALKSDYPSEQIMSRAQFDKYSKMADMDRQQMRLSVDSLRDTVSQVSASVDRLNSVAAGGHSFYSGASPASAGLEAKVLEHEKILAELRAGAGTGAGTAGLEQYSKELEKTRAEVSANYEQVKAVERLLTAQSNKMQAVFSEIQKNLSEYKLTSDTINSTHEAVLHDISELKVEHEHGIDDYRKIAAELSQKVEQNARAVAEMHLMINGLQYVPTRQAGTRQPVGEPVADSSYARAEQKRLLDETEALSATVADLAKKAAAFQEQAAKIASMEEALLRIEHKVTDSDANNAAMFANITTGFSELKKRMESITSTPSAMPESMRMAVVEKGFADLGEKVNSIENGNASLFANLSKSVSRLKAQVDSLQTAAPAASSHEVSSSPDGRVMFSTTPAAQAAAPAIAIPMAASQDGTLLSRIDALERSISSLKVPAPSAPAFDANTPVQFNVTPESIGDNLRLFETRLAYLESFKGELDSWKEQAAGISEKVDSLYSSHAQLVQEVASVVSEKQSDAFSEEQFSKTQAEESKALLNELKVQTELLSSKLAATETNVSMVVGQRFSQLQTQADRLNADFVALKAALPEADMIAAAEERQARALATVDSRLSQTIEERFQKAQQASSQQSLEFAAFRDSMPEKLRLAVAAAESRQADAIGAVDAKVAKLSGESDKLRDFVGKTVSETARNMQDSRTALAEIRARSDELASKITGFSSSQAQFVQELSETIDGRFAEAQQSIERTASALNGTISKFEEKQLARDAEQDAKATEFEAQQAAKAAGFEKKQEQSLAEFRKAQDTATAQFEAQQSTLVSAFESKISSSVTQFEAAQSQMLATFEAKQAEAFSALDSKQADAIAALDKRQADLAAALEVRESQTTSAIDALRVGVEAQKSESEKLAASISARVDTLDAFSRSVSELVAITKTDVSATVEALRKEQETQFAGARATQDALSKTLQETNRQLSTALQETDKRLSAAVSDGLVRSAASIQELSSRSTASMEQLAARTASSSEQLATSINETGKAVATLRSSMDAQGLRQAQEIAAVKAANAALEQKMASVLAALEPVAALSRELAAQRTEVRNIVKEMRAAFNAQAVAQVQDAQKQLAAAPQAQDSQDAKSRQAALEANLSDLEKAIAEIDSKIPAPQQAAAARPQPQFIRSQPQPQPRAQQSAPQYAPQQRPQQPQYSSPIQTGPQQRPRQEYYAPQDGQQARREPPRTISSSIRPLQRPAQRQEASRYGEVPSMGSGGADSAQTEADKQAMDLMAELRGKLLGPEEAAAKPEKKDAKTEDEKEQQQ
ncbi:MAG: hypothetical protein WCX64_02815 [Candidatus Micrarchaeia archaeon]